MTRAVDRLADIQPVYALGMTDEIHDEIHEAITKGMAVIDSGGPFLPAPEWQAEHGFRPTNSMIKAMGYQAQRVLVQAWIERIKIQNEFDGIDQLVATFE